MALTVGQAVERAFYRLTEGKGETETGIYRYAIESQLNDALNQLADMATRGENFTLQQKRLSVGVTSGVGTLPSNAAVQTIPTQGSVFGNTSNYACQYLPSETDLQLPRKDEFIYYTIRGTASVGASIILKIGTLATMPTTLTVTCSVFPTLSAGYSASSTFTDLPTQHEDDLVNILVDLAGQNVKKN